jgi:hypothetical protein
MIFLRVFKHLLPRGRAWRITVNKKLRQFFAGLSGVGDRVKIYLDEIWLDIFPETTRQLDEWEQQFGLPDTGITEQQRRDRLAATWRALGGQSPQYIQGALRANGFDVYVHEWWEPGTKPTPGSSACATPRNPLMYLRREFTGVTLLVECGEALAACGEAFALAGNSLEPRGYPLVNKIRRTVPDVLPLCGAALAACGEETALAGNYAAFRTDEQEYIVPRDPAKWPYFLYIGGENFGDIAQVSPSRKDEFESLCLKICPTQQWIGVLVEYV